MSTAFKLLVAVCPGLSLFRPPLLPMLRGEPPKLRGEPILRGEPPLRSEPLLLRGLDHVHGRLRPFSSEIWCGDAGEPLGEGVLPGGGV